MRLIRRLIMALLKLYSEPRSRLLNPSFHDRPIHWYLYKNQIHNTVVLILYADDEMWSLWPDKGGVRLLSCHYSSQCQQEPISSEHDLSRCCIPPRYRICERAGSTSWCRTSCVGSKYGGGSVRFGSRRRSQDSWSRGSGHFGCCGGAKKDETGRFGEAHWNHRRVVSCFDSGMRIY